MAVRALSTNQAKRFWIFLHKRIYEGNQNLRYANNASRNRLILEIDVYQRLLAAFSACYREPIRSVNDVRAMGGRQTAAFLRSLDADIANLHSSLQRNEGPHEQALASDATRSQQEIQDLEYQLSMFEHMRVSFDMRLADF